MSFESALQANEEAVTANPEGTFYELHSQTNVSLAELRSITWVSDTGIVYSSTDRETNPDVTSTSMFSAEEWIIEYGDSSTVTYTIEELDEAPPETFEPLLTWVFPE